MTFSAQTGEDGRARILWGAGSFFAIDRLGTIAEARVQPDDFGRRFAAQALVRKACGRARVEFGRGVFGPRGGDLRRRFAERVAELANDIAARGGRTLQDT